MNHVGFEVLTSVFMKSTIIWDIKPCSPLKVCLPPAFMLVSCSAYSSILKMEATYSSETSVEFQMTTRLYIREDSTLPLTMFPNPPSWFPKFITHSSCTTFKHASPCVSFSWLPSLFLHFHGLLLSYPISAPHAGLYRCRTLAVNSPQRACWPAWQGVVILMETTATWCWAAIVIIISTSFMLRALRMIGKSILIDLFCLLMHFLL
jgi:hypothetical protein